MSDGARQETTPLGRKIFEEGYDLDFFQVVHLLQNWYADGARVGLPDYLWKSLIPGQLGLARPLFEPGRAPPRDDRLRPPPQHRLKLAY